MEPLTIATDAIRLRPPRAGDVDALVEAAHDPEALRWTRVAPGYTRDQALDHVRRARAHWDADPVTSYRWAVADPDTDAYLGNLDLDLLGAGRGGIGYWLHPAARGRGAMSTAVRALATWAFTPEEDTGLGLGSLRWEAQVGNWPSRRVAWATGFRVEARVRDRLEQRGERRDAWIGTLRRGEPLRPLHPWLDVPALAGKRCAVREPDAADAPRMAEGRNDPVTQHFLPVEDPPSTAARLAAQIAGHREQHAVGTFLNWTITEPDEPRAFAGSVSLIEIDPVSGVAEIGYWLHPAARGRRIASEAVRLAAGHAFAPAAEGGLGLRRLTLETPTSNEASQRVAERCGFTRTGLRRSTWRLGDGRRDDLVMFDLLAEEWAR